MFEEAFDENLKTILVSILCGSVIGFEREFKNKSAGFRTVILICFGSTVFTLLSRMGNFSDDRIAANIVTGIGFLGAGVIYQGKFTVQGLTTAAVIWTMAAIGMVIGFGEYKFGAALTVCMVVILSLFQKLELYMATIYHLRTIHVTFKDIKIDHLDEFEKFMLKHRVKLNRKGVEKNGDQLTVTYEVTGNKKNIREASHEIVSLSYVQHFRN